MAETMHFNYWYITLLSSLKKQQEMAKFCVVWITENLNHMTMDNF